MRVVFLCAVCFCSFKDSLMNGSLVVSLAQKGEIIQNKSQVHNIGNKTWHQPKLGICISLDFHNRSVAALQICCQEKGLQGEIYVFVFKPLGYYSNGPFEQNKVSPTQIPGTGTPWSRVTHQYVADRQSSPASHQTYQQTGVLERI